MLGWQPKHSIVNDIDEEVAIYEKLGNMKEEWSMKELRYDLEVSIKNDQFPYYTVKHIIVTFHRLLRRRI